MSNRRQTTERRATAPGPMNSSPTLKLQTPTRNPVTSARQIRTTIRSETGASLEVETTPGGAMFDLGKTVPHPVIDVTESATQNNAGKPRSLPQKSVIKLPSFATDLTVQPAFTLSQRFTASQTDEAERLFKFVAGVESNVYQEGGRLYYDTGSKKLKHGSLDVSEIIARRIGDEAGVTVSSHTVEARR